VGRERGEADGRGLEVQLHFTQGLYGIGEQNRSPLLAKFGGGFDRLNDPRLVVGPHDRDQGWAAVYGYGFDQRVEVQDAATIDGHDADVVRLMLQHLGGRDHGLVLDARPHDATRTITARETEDSQVVGFASRPGEDHPIAGRAQQFEHAGSTLFYRGPGGPTVRVHAGRVAELLLEIRRHRCPDLWAQRRGGRVVEVDALVRHRHQKLLTGSWATSSTPSVSLV
jgi:hypothetical protein